MVLTVTLNPLLERRLYFSELTSGQVNRSHREELKIGGKGINVSRQLSNLGIKNQAITFLGGENGKHIRRIAKEEQLDLLAVNIKENTRWGCLAIKDDFKLENTFFSPSNNITEKEADEFLTRIGKVVQNSSIVSLNGSSPGGAADKIFPEIIKLAKKYDKFVVLDTYGKHLKECITEAPELLRINKDEVEHSLNIKLDSDKAYKEALDYFYSKGVKISYISNGAENTWASKFNFHYKIVNPKVTEIDGTGSGDAFLSGVIYGLEKALIFDEFSVLGAKLGAINASDHEVCNVSFSALESFTDNPLIESVGKKMKILDDSPTI